MRFLLLFMCASLVILSAQEKAVVSGKVVSASTEEPLGKAIVALQNVEERRRPSGGVRTDDEGRFEIETEPGRYRLTARRNGFVDGAWGQRGPGQPGGVLDLSPGRDMDDIVLSLQGAGVITGRIVDEDGEPLRAMRVEALKFRYLEGKRELFGGSSGMTDDRGVYRIYGLQPDQYYVRVQNAERYEWGMEDMDAKQSYLPTFFPSAPDTSQASRVEATAGAETLGIDIQMFPSPTLSVSGQVIDSTTGRPAQAMIIVFDLEKSRFQSQVARDFVQDPDGKFELAGLRPGSYRVAAMVARPGSQGGTGYVDLELGDKDVEGILVAAKPTMEIHGRVIFEGDPPKTPEMISVYLRPKGPYLFGGGGGMLTPDGRITLNGVGQGEYEVSVIDRTNSYYLKSARFGSRETLDSGLTVTPTDDPPELEVTLSSNGARVAGLVTDADGKPVTGVQVVLVPDDRELMRRYGISQTDQTGVYSLKGVSPGRYKLFAWEQIENGSWQDPNVLKQYEAKGESVDLAEGDAEQLDLKLIPAEK